MKRFALAALFVLAASAAFGDDGAKQFFASITFTCKTPSDDVTAKVRKTVVDCAVRARKAGLEPRYVRWKTQSRQVRGGEEPETTLVVTCVFKEQMTVATAGDAAKMFEDCVTLVGPTHVRLQTTLVSYGDEIAYSTTPTGAERVSLPRKR